MYWWRKFEFFEEKAADQGGDGWGSSSTAVVPAEIAGRVTCCRCFRPAKGSTRSR
jgi:hypothetical protein